MLFVSNAPDAWLSLVTGILGAVAGFLARSTAGKNEKPKSNSR